MPRPLLKRLLATFVFVSAAYFSSASKYSINTVFRDNPIVEFSEYYMYGTNDFDSGRAKVEVDFETYLWDNDPTNWYTSPENYTMVAAVISSEKDLRFIDYFPTLCKKHEPLPDYVEWVKYIPTQIMHLWERPRNDGYEDEEYAAWMTIAHEFEPSQSYFSAGINQLYRARLKGEFEVRESGLVFMLIQACRYEPKSNDADLYDDDFWSGVIESGGEEGLTNEGVHVDILFRGEDTFKNPYGYLPAILYGLLPFEGCRLFGFLALAVLFSGVVAYHKDNLLHIHYGILGVVLVAMLESMFWFAAYADMNITGEPLCCPFPGLLITAMIFETFRMAASRALLLIVCLGFGVTTPELSRPLWTSITVVSLGYLACSLYASSMTIAEKDRLRGEGHDSTIDDAGAVSTQAQLAYVPASILDAVFILWIYVSLAVTMKQLQRTNQSYKFDMYRQLAVVMVVFLLLFIVMSMLSFADAVGMMRLSWKTAWLTTVGWEVLNFAILAAICVIWRPTHRSQMLAYSQQLPGNNCSHDDDDDGGDNDRGGGGGEYNGDDDFAGDFGSGGPDSMADGGYGQNGGGGRKGGIEMAARGTGGIPVEMEDGEEAGV